MASKNKKNDKPTQAPKAVQTAPVEPGDVVEIPEGDVVGKIEETDRPVDAGEHLQGADANPLQPIRTHVLEDLPAMKSPTSGELDEAQAEYDRLAKLCSEHAPETRRLMREHEDARKKLAEARKQDLHRLLGLKLEATKRLHALKNPSE